MARGVLTSDVCKVSVERLGYEISMRELRLMPYLMLKLLDNEGFRREHINNEEREILKKWQKEGYISISRTMQYGKLVRCSTHFYDAISAILKVGYCSDMIIKENSKEE